MTIFYVIKTYKYYTVFTTEQIYAQAALVFSSYHKSIHTKCGQHFSQTLPVPECLTYDIVVQYIQHTMTNTSLL